MVDPMKLLSAMEGIRAEDLQAADRFFAETRRSGQIRSKRILTLALAAALVFSLAVSAYAISLSWSRGMVNAYPGADEEDKQYAEKSGLVTSGTLDMETQNGVTVSVEDMSSDEARSFVCLRITGLSVSAEGDASMPRPAINCIIEYAKEGVWYYSRSSDAQYANYFEETQSYFSPDGAAEFTIELSDFRGGDILLYIGRIYDTDPSKFEDTDFDISPSCPVMAEGAWKLIWTPNRSDDSRDVLLPLPYRDDWSVKLNASIFPSSIEFYGKLEDLPSPSSSVLLQYLQHRLKGVKLADGTIKEFTVSLGRNYTCAVSYYYRFDMSTILQPEQVVALYFVEADGTERECPVETAIAPETEVWTPRRWR